MNNLSKYTWDEMELCMDCHFKDKNPDLCNFNSPPEEKPGIFNYITGCSRYLKESKWKRMDKSTNV